MKCLVFCLLGIASVSLALPVPEDITDEEKLTMVLFTDDTSAAEIEHVMQILKQRSFPKVRHYQPFRQIAQQYGYYGSPMYDMPPPESLRHLPPLSFMPLQRMHMGAPMHAFPEQMLAFPEPMHGHRKEPEMISAPQENKPAAEIHSGEEPQLSQEKLKSVGEVVVTDHGAAEAVAETVSEIEHAAPEVESQADETAVREVAQIRVLEEEEAVQEKPEESPVTE